MSVSKLLLVVVIASFFILPSRAGDGASPASKVAETVGRMRRIKTQTDGALPEALKPLLVMLKHELRDLIQVKINQNSNPINPEDLQQSIIDELNRNGVSIGQDEEAVERDFRNDSYTYGKIDAISISEPVGHADLLAVTTTIGVCCGNDTSLYIFQHRGEKWDFILEQESNFYEDISGAQGSFEYAISEGASSGDFFVVAVDVNPWCTSNWQLIRYKVLRPGSTPDRPKILLNDDHGIYIGRDTVYELKLESHTFTLNFYGDDYRSNRADSKNEDDDYDGSPKPFTLRYKVSGNKVTQIKTK